MTKTLQDARIRYVFEDYHPKEKVVSFIHNENPNVIIFNATRPLFGDTWQGDFISGVFYAAIDPTAGDDFDQKIAAGFIDRNICLDAAILEWFTREDVMEYGRKFVADYNKGPRKISLDDFDFEDILNQYFHHLKDEL